MLLGHHFSLHFDWRFSKTSVVFFLFPSVGQKVPKGVRGSARPVSLALEKATV